MAPQSSGTAGGAGLWQTPAPRVPPVRPEPAAPPAAGGRARVGARGRMADVRPFRGLRFDPARVDLGAVVCPPFDVITPAEQAAYHARDPRNIVRVELGLGPADPAAPANRYAAAAAALAQWQAEGTLVREPVPAFYLYEHEFVL